MNKATRAAQIINAGLTALRRRAENMQSLFAEHLQRDFCRSCVALTESTYVAALVARRIGGVCQRLDDELRRDNITEDALANLLREFEQVAIEDLVAAPIYEGLFRACEIRARQKWVELVRELRQGWLSIQRGAADLAHLEEVCDMDFGN